MPVPGKIGHFFAKNFQGSNRSFGLGMDASSSSARRILTRTGDYGHYEILMNISLLNISLIIAAVLQLCTLNSPAFTISLQEQGSLTGSIVGGGGSVIINPIASDHWSVTVQDMRIGNPTNPPSNLAFIEPTTLIAMTAF